MGVLLTSNYPNLYSNLNNFKMQPSFKNIMVSAYHGQAQPLSMTPAHGARQHYHGSSRVINTTMCDTVYRRFINFYNVFATGIMHTGRNKVVVSS